MTKKPADPGWAAGVEGIGLLIDKGPPGEKGGSMLIAIRVPAGAGGVSEATSRARM
jgi:hypothetical protein